MTEPELQVQISSVFEYLEGKKIAAKMSIQNNLAGPLVHYYDVGNFHATIFKYTRALHVSATTHTHARTRTRTHTQVPDVASKLFNSTRELLASSGLSSLSNGNIRPKVFCDTKVSITWPEDRKIQKL